MTVLGSRPTTTGGAMPAVSRGRSAVSAAIRNARSVQARRSSSAWSRDGPAPRSPPECRSAPRPTRARRCRQPPQGCSAVRSPGSAARSAAGRCRLGPDAEDDLREHGLGRVGDRAAGRDKNGRIGSRADRKDAPRFRRRPRSRGLPGKRAGRPRARLATPVGRGTRPRLPGPAPRPHPPYSGTWRSSASSSDPSPSPTKPSTRGSGASLSARRNQLHADAAASVEPERPARGKEGT